MQGVKLRKVGNSITITLPTSVVESLHLQENDEIAIEVTGERFVLTHATSDFQNARNDYKNFGLWYHNANRKLADSILPNDDGGCKWTDEQN